MAMSKRSLAPCTYGTQCNRGEDCELAHPEPLANMPPILPPSRHSNNQPSDSSMPLSHHPCSPHGTRPDKTISRPPFQKRRPASSIRPIMPTANVIPTASLVSNLETPDFIGRTNTPSNRRYRSNSRTQSRVTIPDVREEHELLIAEQDSLLDQLAESDDTRLVKTTFIEHLKGQLETFNTIISSLHTFNPSTLLEAQNHLNILNREIKRLKTHLPIYARRQDLLDAIMFNRVVILKADTGSGKSTQLVQYLVDAGLADRGQIVCTQPRRLAASTLASRVAEEFGCKLGEEVGFHVGTSRPRVSDRTRIRFVTDAILLNEYHDDPMLHSYSIVVIDEAHERRIDTDLLFGVMKICLQQRNDLKASLYNRGLYPVFSILS
ncbi:unnamed protein product [Rotaria sordida]|uniref:Helicase ATP-binding domain-containing protein n=1 Tax=Rotaria sordida TaxID=392033 RepID=A0A815FJZ6_9BILA|nr:unnamed protein product [Rotaria sordida]CAF1330424.1 unnamed protein product [Rotaria sordida]